MLLGRSATNCEGTGACPDCGVVSSRVHERVVARRRTCAGRGTRGAELGEMSSEVREQSCGCRTFTERILVVPPGARVLPRLKEQCGEESRTGASPRPGRPAMSASRGRSRMPRSQPGPTRRWTHRSPPSRTSGSTSTGAADPGGKQIRKPGSTCSLPTGGTWTSATCPGTRA